MKQYKHLVLVEYRNCPPSICNIISDTPITIEKVVQHFIDTEDFNPERESITFLDEATNVHI